MSKMNRAILLARTNSDCAVQLQWFRENSLFVWPDFLSTTDEERGRTEEAPNETAWDAALTP